MRIAKDVGKMIKEEPRQKVIVAYFLERALSLNPPKEEAEKGCDVVFLEDYRRVMRMLDNEQKVVVVYFAKPGGIKPLEGAEYLTK